MRCDYFDAGLCRSCQWLGMPYADQLTTKQARVASLLPSDLPWVNPIGSAEEGFRNKAKMVVAGTVSKPTLGILDPSGRGIDLQGCGLHDPRLRAALPQVADLARRAGLTPYSVPERRGELKHVLATVSPAGELMIRFVLRSTEAIARLRKHLPVLLDALPVAVVSANLQPEHKAVLEGPDEIVLTERDTLTMEVNGRPLHLRPQSFFQTNTEVAGALYRAAAAHVDAVAPSSVWDLYCGVGGFGLHVAAAGRSVLGVEMSEQAIESARLSSEALGIEATWLAGDASDFALSSTPDETPELVIVNPPRRGIGAGLATWLEESDVEHVVYSSCNARTLAQDLALMPSLRPVSAQLLDMFPHTDHHEVLVLLSRGGVGA
ncbi:23S rRNA (uracil(747)-C(5))-methyltransferase RlmC [Nocardioides sp. Kera G14]|uniref:23S rRNA (uracil(747)-C(5))-methyltransferase RlmC n=1 Tax=Nocardioides sp. Kera G14 TaxID=2884264 RepID=UPI001D107688|nr:23S rRNA (uracil(747)-C(5))-methyltransferase RlmC [Nocardioides sp. Kera G14]UDY23951.1 23S rRNA (uracil(747)-C(5))-methyltransferase RlmC [Nocardioides sp. Kera G14]